MLSTQTFMLMNVSENSLYVYDSSEQPVLDLVNVRITLAAQSFELAVWSCGMKSQCKWEGGGLRSKCS